MVKESERIKTEYNLEPFDLTMNNFLTQDKDFENKRKQRQEMEHK